ncbi:hypothetical protein PML80_06775 [Aerococcus urinaeequi]|uniref:Uncharacterized protein n=1 Tax=Aerococcus urinaeequi TaxID=51665 RepID=A0AAE9XH38_9LACT|nr:hypothetical protein [Aerococcus urinaeequi]WCG37227.1 hypothetical protein PML80_06775 [Aerococcus urinaeequi]
MNEQKMNIYHEIHRLHGLGFNNSQIERTLGVNRGLFSEYLEKDYQEMAT